MDSEKIILDRELGELRGSRDSSFCCNRPSAFYYPQSVQSFANGKTHMRSSIIFATLFGEWYRQYDSQPDIELGQFLANPIRVTENGPTTIHGIVKAHLSLLGKAKSILLELNQRDSPAFSEKVKAGNYRFDPLYKALQHLDGRSE